MSDGHDELREAFEQKAREADEGGEAEQAEAYREQARVLTETGLASPMCNCIHAEGQPHLARRYGPHHWEGCPLRAAAARPEAGDEALRRWLSGDLSAEALLMETGMTLRDHVRAALSAGAGSTREDALRRAYWQACTNLATVRPSDYPGSTIEDDARRYHDALLAGWGGIQGWDEHVAALRDARGVSDDRLRGDGRWLAWSDGRYPDESPGDVIHAEADGTITLDDGITTWNPLRALEWFAGEAVRHRQ